MTEGDDEQDIGVGSAPVGSECLQSEAVTARAGLGGPWWQLESISCCGNGAEEVVAALLGGAGPDPWLGERGGEQGLLQVPSCHAAAGGGWWEFISLREHWHQKGILFCWYLLVTSPFLLLLFI